MERSSFWFGQWKELVECWKEKEAMREGANIAMKREKLRFNG